MFDLYAPLPLWHLPGASVLQGEAANTNKASAQFSAQTPAQRVAAKARNKWLASMDQWTQQRATVKDLRAAAEACPPTATEAEVAGAELEAVQKELTMDALRTRMQMARTAPTRAPVVGIGSSSYSWYYLVTQAKVKSRTGEPRCISVYDASSTTGARMVKGAWSVEPTEYAPRYTRAPRPRIALTSPSCTYPGAPPA